MCKSSALVVLNILITFLMFFFSEKKKKSLLSRHRDSKKELRSVFLFRSCALRFIGETVMRFPRIRGIDAFPTIGEKEVGKPVAAW